MALTRSAPPLVVITGPPGAGKTTVSRLVARSFERSVHIKADDFWHFVESGFVAPWLAESHEQNTVVGTAVHAAAVRFTAGGYTVVLDGIVLPWSLPSLLDEASRADVTVHYVVLRPDEATCLDRAASRVEPTALTDPEPVTKMFNEFRDLGPYERHVLSDERSAEEVAAAIRDAVGAGRFLATVTA